MNEDRAALAAGIGQAFARLPGNKNERCASLGISPPTYDRWRTGASAPRPAALARLARLAGTDQNAIRAATVNDADLRFPGR